MKNSKDVSEINVHLDQDSFLELYLKDSKKPNKQLDLLDFMKEVEHLHILHQKVL
jgi:hypothetical protein